MLSERESNIPQAALIGFAYAIAAIAPVAAA
jgi:hypothetical protein